ncbi:MAG: hypothetical protein E2O76_07305 [Caldithrix sp.]|nr:MAG: hypothetical protein E2O76_07305 [Caldithrix sp.]
MKRTSLIFLTLLFLAIGYVIFMMFFAPLSWVYSFEINESEKLIDGIEKFLKMKERLPTEHEVDSLKSVLDLPTGMSGPCYGNDGWIKELLGLVRTWPGKFLHL